VQGVGVELDEGRRSTTMFKHTVEYNVQMTNILLNFFYLEIKKQTDYRGEG
jgi:hypothetical protein